MIHVTIQIDPKIYAALEQIGLMKKRKRAQIIRDALYSAVWSARSRGDECHLKRALDCPAAMNDQKFRLKGGKVVEVDDWGLEINGDRGVGVESNDASRPTVLPEL